MLDSNPSQKIKVGWRGTPFTFIAHAGLPPGYSHPCQTPWSVFLDGSVVPVPSAGTATAPSTRLTEASLAVVTQRQSRWTRTLLMHGFETAGRERATPGTNGFPLADFKHSLTLFSKFFASFPHGTCSLSVMSQYLALDGIYHPIQAAIPSNPTLQGRIVRPRTATVQDSHLLRYPVPRDLSGGRGRWRLSRLQFGGARGPSRLAA